MCETCNWTRRSFLRLALGAAGAAALASRPAFATTAELPPAERPLIMLDPGHGGHDPGAIAPDGLFEKHITLEAGLELRRVLLATKRYRVAMTRTRDVFISLQGRVNDAVNQNANLFISLHCDHLPIDNLRGASVFTLSNTASDALSADLARDENSADTSAPTVTGVSPKVADILASLETRATNLNSISLAHDIKHAFTGAVPMLPDPNRSANFAVLRDASTPSTLVEMGCLTNKLDEQRLRDPKQRRLIAERLAQAIDVYFAHYAQQRMAG
ncbi:N-acetylmuramoyl-L-alanine amidase [Acidocella sp.]|uniref:N-acetylmuramoyl-L-alanine amidase family protein n=1 Tax=Acidocella sp. TaxID=50710 RepID=UPI002601756A|nr:N-acetylmuramoyl-L-alanine amidase [Acidocella sp.]